MIFHHSQSTTMNRKSHIRAFILGFIRGLVANDAKDYKAYKLVYENITVLIGINQGISHVDGNINHAVNKPDKAQFDLYNTVNYRCITTESRLDLNDLIEHIYDQLPILKKKM